MSLIRMALRLQAIEALNADPVLAAMIEGRVYDSRISAFDHREPVPTILLTAEETKGDAYDKQNGGEPFDLTCDLVLEIAMNAVGQVTTADGASFEAIGYAATDRELEALLDLIEDRAIHALCSGETDAARLLRADVIKRVSRVATSRFATDQTGEKFAVHLVTLTIVLFTYQPDDPFEVPAGEFAALPQPLRAIAEASAPDGSVRDTCRLIAAKLTPVAPAASGSGDGTPAAVAPLTGADMILAPQGLDPDTAPDQSADIGAGRVISVAATITQP